MKKLLLISLLVLAGLSYGKIGQALNFDGVDDYVDAGSGTVLDNITTKTISLWIYKTGANAARFWMNKGWVTGTGGGNGWQWGFRGNGTTFDYRHSWSITNGSWQGTAQMVANRWYHVALTYDASSTSNNPRMFINGVEDTVSILNTPSGTVGNDNANLLVIGAESNAGDNPFTGLIDDVRIYNRAMSASEIRMLYRGNATRVGLVGYWPLIGNTSGTFEPDFSGKGNHGTRTLGPYRSAMSPYMRFRR